MSNKASNRAGLTLAGATGQTPHLVTGRTADGETKVTPSTRTRRRYKPRPRKCRCGCGETVTPTAQAPHKVYASDTCRKRDQRRRAAKAHPPTKRAAPILELATCQFCGASFFVTRGHTAKYCKPAHRVAAAECRRDAAVEALAIHLHWSTGEALDLIDRSGMKKISQYLRQAGYYYDEQARQWDFALRLMQREG